MSFLLNSTPGILKNISSTPSAASCSGLPQTGVVPRFIIHKMSATRNAVPKSWVATTIVLRFSRERLRSRANVSILLSKSRNAVGSSSNITGVCCARVLAIIVFWRSPSLSEATGRLLIFLIPVRANAFSTISRSSSPSFPKKSVYGILPSDTSSSTVICAENACRSVSTTPTILACSRREYCDNSTPFTYICPDVGG